ncbi:MAG: 2Fe-2S iron-sulfur cluster binding domain-containing protein [Desulfobacteraceae bacterium]|nr:2Fe-2S iron-sulfur cluster binding domain-containing protein [Desulfobacteraceae bacterium]
MTKLKVDDREIEAREGTSLLQACLENNIYIPNLCYLEEMEHPHASCRMCFVEIEGEDEPVASCCVQVQNGLVVRTDTPFVRRLQRSALRLLLSVHDVDCANCPANKKCELQRMAKFLKVALKPKGLEQFLKEPQIEEEHPVLNYYPNRCVVCGKCVFVNQKGPGKPFLTFANRGFETVISFHGQQDAPPLPDETYKACVEVCPVGAITLKENDTHFPGAKEGS